MTLDHQKRALCTPEFRALSGAPDSLGLLEAHWRGAEASGVERLVATDIQMYLPDDLLVKMDIASMAHSLEVRSPFLDHHVVEFAARVPASFKLQRGRTKPLLADVVAPSLPPSVPRRRRRGHRIRSAPDPSAAMQHPTSATPSRSSRTLCSAWEGL